MPVIGAFVMWTHVIQLLFGWNFYLAEYSFSLPLFPWLVCMLWSKAFNFCAMHRCFISYTTLVTYCINIQEDVGFNNLILARVIVCLIGLILFIWFAFRYKKYDYKCFKDE